MRRLKAVPEEIKSGAGETFIDDSHLRRCWRIRRFHGRRQHARPCLLGELRLIGATTPDEYRENIEKDPTGVSPSRCTWAIQCR